MNKYCNNGGVITVKGKAKYLVKNRMQPMKSYHVNISEMLIKLSVC